jgi:hypothetical protein
MVALTCAVRYAEGVRGLWFEASKNARPYLKNNQSKKKRAESIAQVIEHLTSKSQCHQKRKGKKN